MKRCCKFLVLSCVWIILYAIIFTVIYSTLNWMQNNGAEKEIERTRLEYLSYQSERMSEDIAVVKMEITEELNKPITGIASWYDYRLGGGWWSISHATAAHRSLVRYSHAKVTNIANGRSVVVFINDFGPTKDTGREIDLSSYAFSQLADLSYGLISVKIEPLQDLSTISK